MNERVEIIVHGRVQMVMYRDFTTRKARALELVGEVENLANGTVRVVAEGDHSQIQKLITKLRTGPILAHVERLDIVNVPPTDEFSSFTLIR